MSHLGNAEFELIKLEDGRAMLLIDYTGAPAARRAAELSFVGEEARLESSGQSRVFRKMPPELFEGVAFPFQVAEVAPSGAMMRIYPCTISRVTQHECS